MPQINGHVRAIGEVAQVIRVYREPLTPVTEAVSV